MTTAGSTSDTKDAPIVRLGTSTQHRLSSSANYIGRSQCIQDVLERAWRAARTDSTVLIRGESGTGKELIARIIHQMSTRQGRPFLVVNIAAVPSTLLESELFGHVKGAFTDACEDRTGRFQAADGGTMLIDEIGDLALDCQVKLLRVLEDQRITPVGSGQARRVDIRMLAATRRNLEEMMSDGEFREDLFYRLNVVTVHIPPLRQRVEDIPVLIEYFLADVCQQNNRAVPTLDDALMRYLCECEWPGNVRQLRNCIESMAVMTSHRRLTLNDLPPTLRKKRTQRMNGVRFPGNKTLTELEKLIILERLAWHHGNRCHAAKSLGISVRTLQRRLRGWGYLDGSGCQTPALHRTL
jgi:transcriptional regulator with PAS, ATPase and Fis domain